MNSERPYLLPLATFARWTMKRDELQKCVICNKGVMNTGLPLFFEVKLQRMCIDMKGVRETAGLEMM